MSKDSATVIKNGQLAVATVPQTGTLVGAASEIDATALVETAEGLQLCIKTCEVGGGGGGGTVDQTYDPTSTNAQSGTAVAEAVAPAIQNESTKEGAVCIGGYGTTVSTHKGNEKSIVIGKGAYTDASYSLPSVIIGSNTAGKNASVTIGTNAGSNTYDKSYNVVIGTNSNGSDQCIAIGAYSYARGPYSGEIAIGSGTSATSTGAVAQADNAIQLGVGTNATENSFQVFTFQMLDGTTGKIPMARLPIVQCTQAEYDALVSGGTVDANTIYCIIPA